jgi:hypothetical protein
MIDDGADEMLDDVLEMPDWLDRGLTEAEREKAWLRYVAKHLDNPKDIPSPAHPSQPEQS